MRFALAALAAFILVSCSSSGRSPIMTAVVDAVRPGNGGEAEAQAAEAGAAPRARLTRAKIEELDIAMIRGKVEGDTGRGTLLLARTVNGEFVSYMSQGRQSFTLQGGLITASRGVGHDLLSVKAAANDPVAHKTPPDDWPQTVSRSYFLSGGNRPEGVELPVTCAFQKTRGMQIEIVEITYDLIMMVEQCKGEDAEFVNVHLADPESGFIWKSAQWLGPDQGMAEYEVLEPLE